MSEVQYFVDNDFNERIVDGVNWRRPAIRLVLARDAGMATRPDDAALTYAAEHAMILLSHDVSTMRPAAHKRVADGKPMSGLLLAQQRKPVGPIIDDLILIWSATEFE